MFGGYIGYESTRQAEARVEITDRIAERGARLFVNNCRTCHGLEGEGHVGPKLNRPGFVIVGEHDPSGAPPTPQGEADAVNNFLFNTISCGRTNTFMPMWAQRFGGSLSDTQIHQIVTMITQNRWDLVKEIGEEHDTEVGAQPKDILVQDASSLALTEKNCGQYTADNAADIRNRDPFKAAPAGGAATGTPEAGGTGTPAPAGGPAAEGKTLATSNGCTACHSVGGAAGVGPTWKGLAGHDVPLADGSTVKADDAYLKESIVNPGAKIVKGFSNGIMPANFKDKLTDAQIDAIIAYIKTLQ
jgi:mono/diheme cytochrome c family protein